MKGLVRVGIAVAVVVGLLGFGAVPASATHITATHVTCGQTITHDTTLDSDVLDCPGDGAVIGADKITLDLNGHTVAGRGCSDFNDPNTCVSQDGIVNAGHDRVVIENGTITKFENAVIISDGDRNQLVGLHITRDRAYDAPGTGISMLRSERSRISDTEVSGGSPAVLLSDSDRNTIEKNFIDGFIAEHVGDGLDLQDGSDNNRVVDNRLLGDGFGFAIDGSRRNLLEGNQAGGHSGNGLRGAEQNTLVENTLSGGSIAVALTIGESTQNRISGNAVSGLSGIILTSGDGNIVESNHVGPTDGVAIDVAGSDNVVRNNAVAVGEWGIAVSGSGNIVQSNSVDQIGIGILVQSDAVAAVIEDNLATRARDDGIRVDALGTLIRRNVANDNGDFGIEAVEGVIDGGGNRASGNGNPLQCLNVFCK